MIISTQHDTSPDEDKGIAFVLAQANKERQAQNPPQDPLDARGYLTAILAGAIASYAQQYRGSLKEDVGELVKTATDQELAAVYLVFNKPVPTVDDAEDDVSPRELVDPTQPVSRLAQIGRSLKFWS